MLQLGLGLGLGTGNGYFVSFFFFLVLKWQTPLSCSSGLTILLNMCLYITMNLIIFDTPYTCHLPTCAWPCDNTVSHVEFVTLANVHRGLLLNCSQPHWFAQHYVVTNPSQLYNTYGSVYHPIASNPGFQFWFLSHSFGEGSETKSGMESLGSTLATPCPTALWYYFLDSNRA